MKIYLGGPMFKACEVEYNIKFAKLLRSYGFEVYCPNENASINDKTRVDITPENVYLEDLKELEDSNVFICQVAEDSGTMWEAGFMDAISKYKDPNKYYGVIGLATDIRLKTLPNIEHIGIDNQAGNVNAFISGGLKLSLGVYYDASSLINKLKEVKNEKE